MKKEEETEFDNTGSHTLLLKELYLFTIGTDAWVKQWDVLTLIQGSSSVIIWGGMVIQIFSIFEC